MGKAEYICPDCGTDQMSKAGFFSEAIQCDSCDWKGLKKDCQHDLPTKSQIDPNATTKRVRENGGGLHVNMDYEKSVFITEPTSGEQLEVIYNGPKGRGQISLTFKGPKVFEIKVANGRRHRGPTTV